jgi:antitoxin (DNA-binding transcriptional repressor) of toxin-antitoxin stability system
VAVGGTPVAVLVAVGGTPVAVLVAVGGTPVAVLVAVLVAVGVTTGISDMPDKKPCVPFKPVIVMVNVLTVSQLISAYGGTTTMAVLIAAGRSALRYS